MRSWGFTPATADPPQNARILNRLYVIITISEGAVQGDRHGPFRRLTRALWFNSLENRILKKPIFTREAE